MRPDIKRAMVGVLLATVTLFAASACAGNPPGTDGNLANEWGAFAEPKGWTPEVETCHKEFAVLTFRRAYDPVSCTDEHRYETAHLGEFTGDAAKLTVPPTPASAEMTAAWKDCDAKATAYLGGEWRHGRIWVGVSLPSPGAWEGGARWFRCEVSVRPEVDSGTLPWLKSLKGEFAKESELKYTCYQIPKDEEADWIPTVCTKAHNAEFVGVIEASDAWEKLGEKAVADKIHEKCRSAIAKYVGVPDNSQVRYRTGTYYRYPSRNDWTAGNHTIQCYLWRDDKTFTRSLKGAGNAGLPVD